MISEGGRERENTELSSIILPVENNFIHVVSPSTAIEMKRVVPRELLARVAALLTRLLPTEKNTESRTSPCINDAGHQRSRARERRRENFATL